jgi:transposase
MPWKESKVLDERKRFIVEWKKGEEDVAELCRRYGISRQTGYTWAKRYEESGVAGLENQSRAPLQCPSAQNAARHGWDLCCWRRWRGVKGSFLEMT